MLAGVSGLYFAYALAVRAGLGLGFDVCPFRALTGVPCPLCGLTTSWAAALDGRLDASIAAHPVGLPLLAAWIGFSVMNVQAVVALSTKAGSVQPLPVERIEAWLFEVVRRCQAIALRTIAPAAAMAVAKVACKR
jgi:hypothetical protein